jgi:outer membrane receptor protein involved in Fe transport
MSRLFYRLVVSAASAAALHAQSVAPAPAAKSASEEAVLLTPFEVSTNSDVGYLGQNTLAGSRMNSSLKDLSAAISPLTEEFLKDIAATNVMEAVEYGVNTRMDTDDGRLAGPVGDSFNGVREIRIRGLPGGSRTVNYFRTLDEVDTYKVGGMEVARGPNSILYGFGSPAGVVNSPPRRPVCSNPTPRSLFVRIRGAVTGRCSMRIFRSFLIAWRSARRC